MIGPARTAAFQALQQIARDETTTLGDALARARAHVADERDRGLVNEIVTGTLRHRAALDYQLSLRITRKLSAMDAEVLTILRLSAFQLLHLTRVPAAAIVNDAVSLTRAAGKTSASGLVNAVLRRIGREREGLTWPARSSLVEHFAIVHSHPSWLVERWLARYGEAATERWLAFDNEAAALTLAANTARTDRDTLATALADAGVQTRAARVAPRGLVVTDGQALSTASFRDGLCLVQDEASQLVAEVVPIVPGDRVLDACAAPGGKTVALAARTGRTGRIVATDVRARRVRTLHETMQRCQVDNVSVAQIDVDTALPFAPGAFHGVLVDAPCSGLGTLRRDPDIRWRRGPDDLARFAEAQLAILARVAPLVRDAGYLVYSTCSSEPEENEAVVGRFLDTHRDYTLEPPDLARLGAAAAELVTAEGYFRTVPFRDGLEAFFAAVLRRR